MTVYVCGICGYEYDRSDSQLEDDWENTDFDDLPDTWVCPLCGAGKEDFEAELRVGEEEY